jgi:hypothetical protein
VSYEKNLELMKKLINKKVGQMQGKFQMQVLPLCGHAVHEDSPEHVADALSNFMIRYKFTHALEEINAPKLCC